MSLNEAIVEDAALTWFGEHGYAIGGPLTARPIGLSVLRPEQANRAFDAVNQVACEKRTDRWLGAKMFSMTPKNKRPRQSPEPVADRESPVHGNYFTGYDTINQPGVYPTYVISHAGTDNDFLFGNSCRIPQMDATP